MPCWSSTPGSRSAPAPQTRSHSRCAPAPRASVPTMSSRKPDSRFPTSRRTRWRSSASSSTRSPPRTSRATEGFESYWGLRGSGLARVWSTLNLKVNLRVATRHRDRPHIVDHPQVEAYRGTVFVVTPPLCSDQESGGLPFGVAPREVSRRSFLGKFPSEVPSEGRETHGHRERRQGCRCGR